MMEEMGMSDEKQKARRKPMGKSWIIGGKRRGQQQAGQQREQRSCEELRQC